MLSQDEPNQHAKKSSSSRLRWVASKRSVSTEEKQTEDNLSPTTMAAFLPILKVTDMVALSDDWKNLTHISSVKPRAVYTRARIDRSGSLIHDMLLAHAYMYTSCLRHYWDALPCQRNSPGNSLFDDLLRINLHLDALKTLLRGSAPTRVWNNY
jgi:hypothetical protein